MVFFLKFSKFTYKDHVFHTIEVNVSFANTTITEAYPFYFFNPCVSEGIEFKRLMLLFRSMCSHFFFKLFFFLNVPFIKTNLIVEFKDAFPKKASFQKLSF